MLKCEGREADNNALTRLLLDGLIIVHANRVNPP